MRNRKLILIKGAREVLPFSPPLPCSSAQHIKVFVPFNAAEYKTAKPWRTGHVLTVRRDSLRTITVKGSAMK